MLLYSIPIGAAKFLWKRIWKSIKSPDCFLGKSLSANNLRKRNTYFGELVLQCNGDGEAVCHLFLHCPSWELWDMIFAYFGVCWVMSGGFVDLVACWQGWCGWHWNSEIWKEKAIPHCWKEVPLVERIARNFEGCGQTVLDLKLQCSEPCLNGWQC